MGELSVKPLYARGEMVIYRDHHDRKQEGEVLSIEARWMFGRDPHITYTLRHPSYANRRFYGGAESIFGRASLPSIPTPKA